MKKVFVVLPASMSLDGVRVDLDGVRVDFPELKLGGLVELVRISRIRDVAKTRGLSKQLFLLCPGAQGNDPALVEEFMSAIAGREFKEYVAGDIAGHGAAPFGGCPYCS